ncbi:MAG: septation protein A [Sulfuricellaceae bacterium]|nr:septation protein A [Sulfuricellaceae bacterium]
MKFLFDFFPILLFFAVFKLYGIYAATATAIVATFAQIGWVWVRHRKVDTMLWVSLAIITVFGGATLLLHDETFIKWKPTVLYWLFAVVLLASAGLFKKNLIRTMMEKQFTAPDFIWRNLNLAWALFFAAMGVLNLYVAFNFSTDIWVNFKLFGSMGLMFVFVILQGLALSKYIEEKAS